MPRLRPIEKEEASADALPYYERDEARYGDVLGNTKLYAHNFEVLRTTKALLAGFAEMDRVPLATKALIRTRVAVLNGCPS
jgi:hypothetical protein